MYSLTALRAPISRDIKLFYVRSLFSTDYYLGFRFYRNALRPLEMVLYCT